MTDQSTSVSGLKCELEERLRFQTLISDISAQFVNIPASLVDREIEAAQRAICECLQIDHSALWRVSADDSDQLLLTHRLRSPDLLPAPDRAKASEFFPWAQRKIQAKEIICVPDTAKCPPEAAIDMVTWQHFGSRSTLAFPLMVGGGPTIGVLSFDDCPRPRDWPETLQKRLQLIAQVSAGALDRKYAEQKLRESEARMSLAADSANAGMWTLEPKTGHIWATRKTYELLGLLQDQGIDLAKFFAFAHPDDQEMIRRSIQEAIESGRDSASEYRVLCPGESVRWIASRGRRQWGDNGEPDRLMGVSIDITESRKVVQELKTLKVRLQVETDYLGEEIKVSGKFEEIVGQSEELKKVFQKNEQVASTDSAVLITGETGTGKELVARAIHSRSRRKDRVMAKVDCTALPPSLIENEVFGREKGAYAGTLTKQMGRFELANGSTLFLDEIGELPLELQAKLLRVVQDGEFERLGSPKTLKVDVRIIAATHRDLSAKVKDGTFREDLFYRLAVFPIHLPALRERVGDTPLLVWTFVKEFERRMCKTISSIAEESMRQLQAYSWPGNVRELLYTIEQAMILSNGHKLNVHMPASQGTSAPPTLKRCSIPVHSCGSGKDGLESQRSRWRSAAAGHESFYLVYNHGPFRHSHQTRKGRYTDLRTACRPFSRLSAQFLP
jgi:PAS domain S-box-containing protein